MSYSKESEVRQVWKWSTCCCAAAILAAHSLRFMKFLAISHFLWRPVHLDSPTALHPDPCVASRERIPPTLCTVEQHVVLLGLRVGYMWTGVRQGRIGLATPDLCHQCVQTDMIKCLLFRSIMFAPAHQALFAAHCTLGLSINNLGCLLWPCKFAWVRDKAHCSLANFFDRSGLIACLKSSR